MPPLLEGSWKMFPAQFCLDLLCLRGALWSGSGQLNSKRGTPQVNHFEPALNGACGTAAIPHQCSKAVNLAASQVFALRHGDFIPNLLPAESPDRPAQLWLGSRVAPTLLRAGWLGVFPQQMEFSIESPHSSVFLLFSPFVLRLKAWHILQSSYVSF